MRDVYLVPYGGLGNQLFQFACARALSERGKINILTDWGSARRNPSNQIELRDLDLGPDTTFVEKSLPRVLKRCLNFFLRLGAERRANSIVCKFGIFILSIVISFKLGTSLKLKLGQGLGHSKIETEGDLLILGYFQSYIWASEVIDELRKVSTNSLSFKASNLIGQLKGKEVLIVHVRRGDYMNEDFGVLDDDYYAKALDAHDEKSYDEIWVFSDEQDSARKIPAFKRHPRVVFIDDSHLRSSEILEIMRGGSGYVIANSSFSWWAATLRTRIDALVVSPAPWFKTQNTPNEITDPSWVSIVW